MRTKVAATCIGKRLVLLERQVRSQTGEPGRSREVQRRKKRDEQVPPRLTLDLRWQGRQAGEKDMYNHGRWQFDLVR